MTADDNLHSQEREEKSGKSGSTRISAKIDKIDKDAEAEFSRVHEKDVEAGEEKDSERDFHLKLNIKEVKGSISLADIIKKKSKGGPKKIKIL